MSLTKFHKQHCCIQTKTDGDTQNYLNILLWARMNFELQFFLNQKNPIFDESTQIYLSELNYCGKSLQNLHKNERDELVKNGFFSSMQTGRRIIAFALKQGEFNKTLLLTIERGVTDAYSNVISNLGKTALLKQTYKDSMQMLSIFT